MAIAAAKGGRNQGVGCGFESEATCYKFFAVVALFLFLFFFGILQVVAGGGKLPSEQQCAVGVALANHPGNDLIPGGISLEDNYACCEKCAQTVGAVLWVYHTPMALQGAQPLCFCKSKVGPPMTDTTYMAGAIANPAAAHWGGTLLLLVGLCGTLYIGGGAFVRHRQGMRDVDMIPNSLVWSALPGLILDGAMFAMSQGQAKGGGGGGGYTAVSAGTSGSPVAVAGITEPLPEATISSPSTDVEAGVEEEAGEDGGEEGGERESLSEREERRARRRSEKAARKERKSKKSRR